MQIFVLRVLQHSCPDLFSMMRNVSYVEAHLRNDSLCECGRFFLAFSDLMYYDNARENRALFLPIFP